MLLYLTEITGCLQSKQQKTHEILCLQIRSKPDFKLTCMCSLKSDKKKKKKIFSGIFIKFFNLFYLTYFFIIIIIVFVSFFSLFPLSGYSFSFSFFFWI